MKKALDLFRRLEFICLVVPMAVLCTLIFVQIVMRSMFQGGIAWLEEFSRYVFVFCTFLGASIAVETDSHPKMTAVVVAVPEQIGYLLQIIGNLFCCALSLLVTWYGTKQILSMMSIGARATALPIPMYVPYLIIPLGLLVGGIRYLYQSVYFAQCLAGKTSASTETISEEGGGQE